MVGIKRRAFQAEPRGAAGGVSSTVVYWAPEQSRWMETMDVQAVQSVLERNIRAGKE